MSRSFSSQMAGPKVLTAEAAETPVAPIEHEVIGKDDRQLVADTLAIPNRWVCAIDLFVEDPRWGRGRSAMALNARATGILIGPRHVLTAAHVLASRTLDLDGTTHTLPIASVRVSPARNGDNDSGPLGHASSTTWYVSRAARPADDYALIVLDQDVSARTHKKMQGPLGYWGRTPAVAALRRLDPARVNDSTVTVVGYPGDRCGKASITGSEADKLKGIKYCVDRRRDEWASTQWRASGVVKTPEKLASLVHSADTYQGESGAPICLTNGTVLDLLGVHSGMLHPAAGKPIVWNRGARVTRRMLRELCSWINSHARRTWARVHNDALVFDLPGAGAREMGAAADEVPAPARGLPQLRGAVAKVEAGLREAAALLPKLPDAPTRDLLDFVVSLLRTQFFPRGHGLIDAQGRVLTAARRGRIEMHLERADGSHWPFDHRVLVWLSARRPDNARVAGRHGTGSISSVVTLYTQDMGSLSGSGAAALAVHEFVHMLMWLIERLRQVHGDAVTRRFLARQPWQRLDTQPFKTHQRALATALGPLQRLLPMPVSADELADSLLGEAMAYTLGQWLASTLDAAAVSGRRGPKLTWESISITDLLVRQYVLERSPQFLPSLSSPQLSAAVARIKPPIDALTQALRAHWAWVPMHPAQRGSRASITHP